MSRLPVPRPEGRARCESGLLDAIERLNAIIAAKDRHIVWVEEKWRDAQRESDEASDKLSDLGTVLDSLLTCASEYREEVWPRLDTGGIETRAADALDAALVEAIAALKITDSMRRA